MVALNPINNNAADFRDLQVGTPTRHFYYTNHWQRIEERHELNGSPGNALSLHAQWLPGARYIDDHVLRDVVSTPGDVNIDADQRKYYLSDANWNTVALVGKTSTGPDVWGVQERYAYQPYGMPIYLNPDFSTKTTQESGYAVESLFQGLIHVFKVKHNDIRRRGLHPSTGGFLQRDPTSYRDGMNLYLALRNDPTSQRDPFGLQSEYYEECTSSIEFLDDPEDRDTQSRESLEFTLQTLPCSDSPEGCCYRVQNKVIEERTCGLGQTVTKCDIWVIGPIFASLLPPLRPPDDTTITYSEIGPVCTSWNVVSSESIPGTQEKIRNCPCDAMLV